MNEQSYIASGIITDYCLGLLGGTELERTENASLIASASAFNAGYSRRSFSVRSNSVPPNKPRQ